MEDEATRERQTKDNFTREDIKFLVAMAVVTIGFSIRTGEFLGALLASLKQLFIGVFYGFGVVFIFIGLTKKMFKYNPTKVQIIKWAFLLAAIFAVSQFFHEAFLMMTGQMPPPSR